jgi:hypothetical protein
LAPSPRAPLVGLAFTLGVHVLVIALTTQLSFTVKSPRVPTAAEPEIVWLRVTPPEAQQDPPSREPAPAVGRSDRAIEQDVPAWVPQERSAVGLIREPATQAAPPAPTAEEWAFASRYTLKNGKAYRYTWGQQVRSMMGTAVEGPEQGMVRFRVEIAPDGTLAKLETLWTTSAMAERLARQAVESMPRWPSTPTGQPLVFEKTIAFTPFASDVPPLYKDDCLPEPPAFKNPFAWDGRSAQEPVRPQRVERPDPKALEDCLRQLPQDSIEAEAAHDERLLERWASPRLGR